MIATVALGTWAFGGLKEFGTLFSGDPIFHMMAGGLVAWCLSLWQLIWLPFQLLKKVRLFLPWVPGS